MMKVLEIVLPDNSIWHTPLEPLAKDRATYYACEVDGHDRFSNEWEEEFNYGMHPSGILDIIDFVSNNKNWNELNAYKVKDPSFDYSRMWVDATLYVKEV